MYVAAEMVPIAKVGCVCCLMYVMCGMLRMGMLGKVCMYVAAEMVPIAQGETELYACLLLRMQWLICDAYHVHVNTHNRADSATE
jgi:hypothetical protein